MKAIIAEFEDASNQVSWGQLDRAGGSADDTPRLLRSLWAGGEDVVFSYGYLWSGLLGGGEVWGATAPAAYLLSILIRDDQFGGDDKTLREGVLAFFRELALQSSSAEARCTPVASIAELVTPVPEQACGLVLPTLLEAELSLIGSEDWRLASYAATAAVAAITKSRCPFQAERHMLIESLRVRIRSADSLADRAGALIDLGHMGQDLFEYLSNGDFAVRLAAALGSTKSKDPRVFDVLLDAARRCNELDSLFSPAGDSSWTMLPQFGSRGLSVIVAEQLCARTEELGLLVQPLISATDMTKAPGGYLAARPYYRKFFANGLPALGEVSRHQMEIICLIAASDGYWGQPGWQRFLAGLKLPTSRESWQNYCQLRG